MENEYVIGLLRKAFQEKQFQLMNKLWQLREELKSKNAEMEELRRSFNERIQHERKQKLMIKTVSQPSLVVGDAKQLIKAYDQIHEKDATIEKLNNKI